jgi:hypothetical protein
MLDDAHRQTVRRRTLAAIAEAFPPEEDTLRIDEALSEQVPAPRYAIIQRDRTAAGADSYWIDLSDDAEETLRGLSCSFSEHGWLPFAVVDLDSGRSRYVDVRFLLGEESDNTRYDFTEAASLAAA